MQSARSVLDMHIPSVAPTVDFISGWALRVIYLRITAFPHEAWIASSTLMHFVEASGFYLGSLNETIILHSGSQSDHEMRGRVYALARHMNSWTFFDLGLTRVTFRHILPLTTSLDPTLSKDESSLELQLFQILNSIHTHSPLILAQCNIVLCILRQLPTQNREISANLTEPVLALLRRKLFGARSMAPHGIMWRICPFTSGSSVC